MNLLCPNCQKMLTVPDEFAGQTMKCPLCDGAFSVPSLPGVTAPPPSAPEPDIYSVRGDSPPAPPPPSVSSLQPPTPADLSSVPSPPPSAPSAPSAPAPQPPRTSPGQPRVLSLSINPTVLPWLAPVCLLLVFFLQFFTWLGLYPGGVASVTQNAWQAAFGSYSMDPNLPHPAISKENKETEPHVSVLTLFYLILFIPILLITIAGIVLPLLPVKLPPGVERFWPWRWGIIAAANLILFLFLFLQLLLGFSLESRYADWVDKQVKTDSKESKDLPHQMREDSERGKYLQDLYRTIWLKLAVFLHLLAILGAAMMYWIDRRGAARPLPQLELRW